MSQFWIGAIIGNILVLKVGPNYSWLLENDVLHKIECVTHCKIQLLPFNKKGLKKKY